MNGALKFKRVQSSRWQANHTSKISKMYWEGTYYYLKAEESFMFAKILQSNKLRPLTTASMTKTGACSYKLITASLAFSQQGSSPMCLGFITFPLTYTPSVLTSASPTSGDQDSWQDLDTIWYYTTIKSQYFLPQKSILQDLLQHLSSKWLRVKEHWKRQRRTEEERKAALNKLTTIT